MVRRFTVLVLAMMLMLTAVAYADSESWTCPSCSQKNNTGNFCSNCGTARPGDTWMCINCGQTGNTGNFCSNCGSPNTESNESVNKNLQQIQGETDNVMVCPLVTSSSSHIINKKRPDLWIAENATDNNETTCWQFSAKKGLKGKSWIQLEIPSEEAVNEIWFKNGFWAYSNDEDQYPINARIKDAEISFKYVGEKEYKDKVSITLKDEGRNGWQKFDVGHHENVDIIRVSIYTTYKGTVYPNDVCLTEIMAVQHSPAIYAMAAGETAEPVTYEGLSDTVYSDLKQRLSTRSGPGTKFTEPGTFFSKNYKIQKVKVLKKSSDGNTWWVQVDFRNGAKNSYRVWTGAKRVDVDLDLIAEELPMGQCDVTPTSDTYYGPGGNYAKANITITKRADGIVYEIENGYADVEYMCDDGTQGRIWVPEANIVGLETNQDHSGDT